MWPFDRARRKYERRYKAALIVLLGAHRFAQLDSTQRARVESMMTDNLKRSPEPPAALRRWAPWDSIAAFRAAAMQDAAIDPGIPGLPWTDLFSPWPFDPATADAKALLRRSGIIVPDIDPYGPGELDGLGPDLFLRNSGLPDHSRKEK